MSAFSFADAPPAAGGAIDTVLAGRYFQEAKAISDRDGGAMWGASLYGSTLLVDEATREVVANRPDYKDLLVRRGDVYVGTLPPEENIANTSTRWLGVTWTMLRWPLPEDPLERDTLMIHESFHRIQDSLGLGGTDPSNDHLDSLDGRIWMQLEWRALRVALQEKKEARRKAVQDALTFRACRRSLFPDAAAREQALEMYEGLPEYTGLALATKNRAEALAYAAARLNGAPSLKTFVRSFAYITGPAYGLLLDDMAGEWRKTLKANDDLSNLLAKACNFSLSADLKAVAQGRAATYGGKDLTATEEQRATKKRAEIASYVSSLVEGPVLILPMTESFNYSFDPTDQVPLDGWGTVYPYLRVSSSWGVLEATKSSLLIVKDTVIQGIRVPAPKDISARPLQGEGWKLDLKAGWAIVPGECAGDF